MVRNPKRGKRLEGEIHSESAPWRAIFFGIGGGKIPETPELINYELLMNTLDQNFGNKKYSKFHHVRTICLSKYTTTKQKYALLILKWFYNIIKRQCSIQRSNSCVTELPNRKPTKFYCFRNNDPSRLALFQASPTLPWQRIWSPVLVNIMYN